MNRDAFMKRTGDTVNIKGDYQYNAAHKGNNVQRFWHYAKKLAIAKYLPPLSSDYILDVGCGSGVITSFLGESGAHVIGIDGNIDAIRFAKNKFGSDRINFVHGLVDERRSFERLADKIYCLEVIEHIYYKQGKEMLDSFYRLLNPDGRVFLTTPNYKSMWPFIEMVMDKFELAPTMAKQQHVEHYDKLRLKKLCLETGFRIRNIRTNCFLAPWVAPLSINVAKRLDNFENRFSLGGSVLIFILEKEY